MASTYSYDRKQGRLRYSALIQWPERRGKHGRQWAPKDCHSSPTWSLNIHFTFLYVCWDTIKWGIINSIQLIQLHPIQSPGSLESMQFFLSDFTVALCDLATYELKESHRPNPTQNTIVGQGQEAIVIYTVENGRSIHKWPTVILKSHWTGIMKVPLSP
jgi:hypothetical protein